MTLPPNPKGDLYLGHDEIDLRCPGCGHWGEIDMDQVHGHVSVDHTNCRCGCTFHETRDWFTEADRVTQDPYA